VLQSKSNTVMLTTSEAAARSWADRFATRWPAIQDSPADRPPLPSGWGVGAGLKKEFDRLEGAAPVRAAAVGRATLARLTERIAAAAGPDAAKPLREALAGASAASAHILPRDDSSGVLTLHVTVPDAGTAAPALRRALRALGAAGVYVEAVAGDRVTVEAVVPELPQRAARALQALAD
jgi:hypothetical protein